MMLQFYTVNKLYPVAPARSGSIRRVAGVITRARGPDRGTVASGRWDKVDTQGRVGAVARGRGVAAAMAAAIVSAESTVTEDSRKSTADAEYRRSLYNNYRLVA